ncbi:MAG TPA: M20 family metallopeptidase [Gemmatimonadaceae bacterium]
MTEPVHSLSPVFSPDQMAWLIDLRRALHRHPELSWKEERTAERLEAALRRNGITEIHRVAGTGIVARVPGSDRDAPVTAIRGDIDALPIQEATGLPYASEVPGVMHACGHDVHATWAIGAAMLLAKHPARGDVLIVLQPAEEVGSGATAVLASGALEDVAAIFGGHVDRRFPVGQVVAQSGPLAASADSFSIDVVGKGAHGARPHEGIDPIVVAASIVNALQTIVARRLDPGAPAIVTVGSIHGGTAPNVIPELVVLTGTLRAMLPDVRAALHDELTAIATAIASAHGASARVTIEQGPPPVVNSERESVWARTAAERVLGVGSVVPFGLTNMGGEDFACYLQRFGGCFLRIGAREAGGEPAPAHSPGFVAAEESIFVGAAVLAECAREASESLATL